MALTKTLFSLERNPIDINWFEGSISYGCSLCESQVNFGYCIPHIEGRELVFCVECFEALKEAIAFIIIREEDRN